MNFKIWIDADACPRTIKEIIFKASKRTNTPIILVANQNFKTPISPLIRSIVVSGDFDAADNYIADNLEENDLVITSDIPLADRVLTNKAIALNPRGELYTQANIKDRLAMRNLMAELRSGGTITGGQKEFGAAEIKSFSAIFDKTLTALVRKQDRFRNKQKS